MSSHTDETAKFLREENKQENLSAQSGEVKEESKKECPTQSNGVEEVNGLLESSAQIEEVKENAEEKGSAAQIEEVKVVNKQQESNAQVDEKEKFEQKESTAQAQEFEEVSKHQESSAQIDEDKEKSENESSAQAEVVKEIKLNQESNVQIDEVEEYSKEQESTAHSKENGVSEQQKPSAQVDEVNEKSEQKEPPAQNQEVKEDSKQQESSAQIDEVTENSKHKESTAHTEEIVEVSEQPKSSDDIEKVKEKSKLKESTALPRKVKEVRKLQEVNVYIEVEAKYERMESTAHSKEVKETNQLQESSANIDEMNGKSKEKVSAAAAPQVNVILKNQRSPVKVENAKENIKQQEAAAASTSGVKVKMVSKNQETSVEEKVEGEVQLPYPGPRRRRIRSYSDLPEKCRNIFRPMSPSRLSKKTNEDVNYVFRVVLVGDEGVGKTSLARRFTQLIFYEKTPRTTHVEYSQRIIETDKVVKVQIWDTPGIMDTANVFPNYFRFADLILLVYDGTDEKSFSNIPLWLSHAREYSEQGTRIVIVSMKLDIKGAYSSSLWSKARQFAKEERLKFHEASAKLGSGVEEVFLCNLLRMYEAMRIRENIKLERERRSRLYCNC